LTNYREQERKRIIAKRDLIFRDPGGGKYRNINRDFVLSDPVLNLWEGIRQDAIQYFRENKISWWGDQGNEVSGHLLSSQIACLNHLYFTRQNKKTAIAILKNISENIIDAVFVEDGYVEFEIIGDKNFLGEKSHSRGANSTSIDAVMVGKKKNGKNILVMIEWKYTEDYPSVDKYIPARANIYNPLLSDLECPIKGGNIKDLYYEPFYQLTRQTLLGWKMTQNLEYGCDEFLHLHIIPKDNEKLRETVTSPGLAGISMSDAWEKVLKEPKRYIVLTPEEFIKPISTCRDTASILNYLSTRYW